MGPEQNKNERKGYVIISTTKDGKVNAFVNTYGDLTDYNCAVDYARKRGTLEFTMPGITLDHAFMVTDSGISGKPYEQVRHTIHNLIDRLTRKNPNSDTLDDFKRDSGRFGERVQSTAPKSLEEQLSEAIISENYELAAELRDKLKEQRGAK